MLEHLAIFVISPFLDIGRYVIGAQYAIAYGVATAVVRFLISVWFNGGLEKRVARLERERRTPMSYNLTWNGTPNYTKGRLFQKVDKIIIHWLNGDMNLADATFSRKSTQVSAHFAVEGSEVHQFVKLQDTAWHAGNWLTNLKSVGIEHSAMPGRDLTDEGYETSAQLIVDICKALGLTPSRALLHKHSEYRATQCPGTIDLDRLSRRAIEIWNPVTGIDQPIITGPVEQGTLASVTVPIEYVVKQTVRAHWRKEPNTTSQIMATYDAGATVTCIDVVLGQDPYGNGINTWNKSKRSGWYQWTGASKRI